MRDRVIKFFHQGAIFDGNLRKRDVMRTEWHPEVIYQYVGEDKLLDSLIRESIENFYFKEEKEGNIQS